MQKKDPIIPQLPLSWFGSILVFFLRMLPLPGTLFLFSCICGWFLPNVTENRHVRMSVKLLPSTEVFVWLAGMRECRQHILGEKPLSQRECIQGENRAWIAVSKGKFERQMEGLDSMGKEGRKERVRWLARAELSMLPGTLLVIHFSPLGETQSKTTAQWPEMLFSTGGPPRKIFNFKGKPLSP